MSADLAADLRAEDTSPLDSQGRAHGVWAPALTPLDAELMPDKGKAIPYYRWLLSNGCHGLALLGTNSEATSFSVAERIDLLESVLEAGIAPERLAASGYGEYQPKADNATDDGKAANRRVELVIVVDRGETNG